MEKFSPWLLLIVSIAACLLGGLARTYYCKLISGRIRDYYLLNGACSVVCALLLWGMAGFGRLQVSAYTLWLGVLFGTVVMVQSLTSSAALRCGPWSYTQVITSLATIIPAVSGALFWHESIGAAQVVGMALLVVCFVCSVDTRRNSDRGASLQWLALCFVAFLGTGAIGVMQKLHQTSPYKGELAGFLVASFAVSAAVSMLIWALMPLGEKRRGRTAAAAAGAAAAEEHTQAENASAAPVASAGAPAAAPAVLSRTKKFWLSAGLFCVLGICTAINHQFNLYLSGVLPAAVFFPVVNGSNLVLVTVCSVVLFRERLSRRQWVGLALGTAAVLLLCL